MTTENRGPWCVGCGTSDARTLLGEDWLCDRCLNDRISAETGLPALPDPPNPEEFIAGDGRSVTFRYRLTWAPGGVMSAEAEQLSDDRGGGFEFRTLAEYDEDPHAVLAKLRSKVGREVGRAYLEPSEAAVGWSVADLEVAGRITWSGESSTPALVIDGRPFDWDAFGRILASFEGWEFSLRLGDGSDEDPGDEGADPDEEPDEFAEVFPLFPAAEPDDDASIPQTPSIDDVLVEFLLEQHERLAEKTYRRYEGIVELLRMCLNGYGYQSLMDDEAKLWRDAFDAGDEDAFTRVCGSQHIVEMYGEFLGYFMIRKVMASQDELKAAATVTKKLARWLEDHDYIEKEAADDAYQRAKEAGHDLPRADQLGEHLYRLAERTSLSVDPNHIADEDWVEDYLPITRVEDGRLWFGEVGPLAVSREASDLAEVGWDVNVVLARLAGSWQLVEVGMVYP